MHRRTCHRSTSSRAKMGRGKRLSSNGLRRVKSRCLTSSTLTKLLVGLSPLAPERAQFEAGRMVLSRFDQFIREKRDFCLETTLSGRTYRKHFAAARAAGYHVRLDFLLLPDVEDSIRRVADRVEQGGHNVPIKDLRRRFRVGVQNLFNIYRQVVDAWSLYDNGAHIPVPLAYGTADDLTIVAEAAFQKVVEGFNLTL